MQGTGGAPRAGRRAGPTREPLFGISGVHRTTPHGTSPRQLTGPPAPTSRKAPLPGGRDHLLACWCPLDPEEMGWAHPIHATLPQKVTTFGDGAFREKINLE